MKELRYLKRKNKAVIKAEKWAGIIRIWSFVVAAAILLLSIFTGAETNLLNKENSSNVAQTLVKAEQAIVLMSAFIGGALYIAVSYFIAALVELSAAHVHSNTILARCALYEILDEDDEEE